MGEATNERRYHHGDLRDALVAAGLQLIESRDLDDLSLRAVAREVSVSATAVYRHFPDKAALMRALAETGLARLADAQRAASEKAGGGVTGFNATGAAYVRFALANPGLFRLIFAHPVPSDPTTSGKPDDAMAMLLSGAAALAPAGEDARVFALRSWSVAHGVAMLMLDGLIPTDDALIEAVVDARGFGQ